LLKVADDLTFIKSMTSKFPEHTAANYFLHTGSGLQGRPSMGAWVGYGLGTENQNLPGFVVLNGGLIPPGGLDNFNSGYLPAAYQGSVFNPGNTPVANIKPAEASPATSKAKARGSCESSTWLFERTGSQARSRSNPPSSTTKPPSGCRAAVPDLLDLKGESDTVKKMYGLESDFNQTKTFGRQCLLARRLVERGVRFIELTCPGGNGDRWDQHNNLRRRSR